MERIHSGWLTKSPQQRKTSGPWKLFQARWRRRFFILYAPPASTLLPGTCSAVLDYYESDRQLFKKGTIDLTNCIEVKLRPDIDVYKHVFSLRTKHRGRDRTYFLFSDNEHDMKHWVDCLRGVLFLDDNNGRDLFLQTSSHSTAQGVPSERYISLPGQALPNNTSTVVRQSLNPSSPSHTVPVSSSPSMSASFEFQIDNENSEQYILLEECFSGPSLSTAAGVFLPRPIDGHDQSNVNHLVDSHPQVVEYLNLSDVSSQGDVHGKPVLMTNNLQYARAPYYSTSEELRLPTKKGGVSTSSSSTDDSDESDDSSVVKHSARDNMNDASVNYLDLDHVNTYEDLGAGKSPGGRSSTGGSDYKDIDWVKTKALNETRKAVENKRKGSEKSVDG